MNRWLTDITSLSTMSETAADLYVQLAEKKLDETVESAKNISDRNDKLLLINITLLTGILGYITSEGWTKILNEYLCTVLFCMAIILGLALIFLIKNILCYKIGTKGEEPIYILKNKFISNYDKSEQYINLALHICEMYQHKITLNQDVNKKRNKTLSISIYIIISLPISFLLALGYYYLI